MLVAILARMPYSRGWKRRQRQRRFRLFLRFVAALRWAAALGVVLMIAWGVAAETRTSLLQSRFFADYASEMNFSARPGPSETVRFPTGGPFDERLGYTELPDFIAALRAEDFVVDRQAQWSGALRRFVDDGGYAIYREKSRAGLQLFGRHDVPR